MAHIIFTIQEVFSVGGKAVVGGQTSDTGVSIGSEGNVNGVSCKVVRIEQENKDVSVLQPLVPGSLLLSGVTGKDLTAGQVIEFTATT